jgi:glycosyltransferase involved in cell wall biosynthesis
MSRHKGLDLLVEALMIEPGRAPEVVLAGPVADEYRTEFDRQLSRLRTAGVQVTTRQWLHSEAGGLDVLARAGCVLLPYPRHGGMSRVLLEAAAVGTPIVANEYGLVGDLVRRHGLGAAVDCRDRVALHRALLEFSSGAAAERFAPGLSAFADRYSFPRFREAVQAPFAATPSSTVP